MGWTDSINPEAEVKGGAQVARTSQWTNRLPWEDFLRESVFRTIAPPQLAKNILYKRIVGARFFRGPLPVIIKNDSVSVTISRGDVFCLPNGRWIFCQEGCINCEACVRQATPVMKWIIRRIKRLSEHSVTRHDLQLTITSQLDGNYHVGNLWPRSYVYVASPGEVLAHSADAFAYADGTSAFADPENNSSDRHGMTNRFSSPPEREPAAIDRSNISIGFQNVLTVRKENSTAGTASKNRGVLGNEQKLENKERPRLFRKQRLPIRTTEKPVECNRSAAPEVRIAGTKKSLPQLILGTDQLGQKHLVHVVATDGKPSLADYAKHDVLNAWPGISGETMRLGNNSSKPDYQELLQKIFHSLVTHRRSIERFLQSPAINENERRQPVSALGVGIEKDEQQLGHEMKGMNPAIGFYPNYYEVNNGHSAIGNVRAVIPDQSREIGQNILPISTTEIVNSIRNKSQVIDTYLELGAATRNNFSTAISGIGRNVSESAAPISLAT